MKRVSDKQRERNKGKAGTTRLLHALFREIWDEREDFEGACYCFETGVRLDGVRYRGNTCCYDHVLEKSKYPEYAMLRSNIVILHPDVHTRKGVNIDKLPKLKAYRDKLLSLHYENKLV